MMKSQHPRRLRGAGLLVGLLVATFSLPRKAWADVYAPFVWSLTTAAVVLLPVITLIEALVLSKLCRLPAWRALGVSLLVNLSSTLVGILLSALLGLSAPVLDIPLVAAFFAGTVWIEGLLLARYAHGIKRPYSLSFRMNILSYAILLACAGLLAHMQHVEKQKQRIPGYSAATSKVHPVPPPVADGGAGDATAAHR